MGTKINCWMYKKCGREPGGINVHEFGVCPASTDNASDGANDGLKAGRICWAISGTFCKGEVQGSFAEKKLSCMTCDFFKKVREDEKESFILLPKHLNYK